MSVRSKGLIGLIVASLFWSTAGVVSKTLLPIIDPFPLAFLRFFFATCIVLPFFLRIPKPSSQSIIKQAIPLSLLSSGNIAFFYLGLSRTTANVTAAIYIITPILASFLAHIFVGERLTKRKLLGMVFGAFGVLCIVLLPVWEKGTQLKSDLLGNLTICVAAFCWAGYTVGSKKILEKPHYTPLFITSISLIIGTIVSGLITYSIPHRPFIHLLADPSIFLRVLYLSSVVTVATYLLYQWVIKHVSATVASLSNYIQPLFVTILAFVTLGEAITGGFFLGLFLLFVGAFLVSRVSLRFIKPFIPKIS